MDEADSDDEDSLFSGVARPELNAGSLSLANDDDDDEDYDEVEAAPSATVDKGKKGADDSEEDNGLLSADAAFDPDTAPAGFDLDPFRVAGPVASAETTEAAHSSKQLHNRQAGKHPVKKMFVGGLDYATTDATLVKFFARFGKVQEATVVRAEDGRSRGFGFVTFVHQKGAAYCLNQAGDPPQVNIDGRSVAVRYAEDKGSGVPHYKMPARGQYNPKPAHSSAVQRAPGGQGRSEASAIGEGKRAAEPHGEEEEERGDAPKRKARKAKQEIVNVSRRQDAEPLYDKPITMRELFPKEFWRV
mmetsp:Transcript_4577/g.7725  ORF Transcript_4577/g.7725 Transcript_4577/m.7725 type:complete len:302 (+) Transcript_4577:27-932(+)|eukprot:CAMPEP_0119300882 /NCGR_PEP_ID=MMETSP1333-20130426/2736_1 /TAXON_ID=418940 /ORGANISM="Scyphosphaera apsteinii, Strain RCC1455" /LENGTH=301 /DNA_ID=CAMNT_0007302801 /DNA_START=27 /DNA_END=932 /DNA_ORIENTATION=-